MDGTFTYAYFMGTEDGDEVVVHECRGPVGPAPEDAALDLRDELTVSRESRATEPLSVAVDLESRLAGATMVPRSRRLREQYCRDMSTRR